MPTRRRLLALYQPQIEQWQHNRFEARAAVAVTTEHTKQPAYGVIWFSARTETDKINRLVTMTDFVITKVSFPATPDRASAFQRILRQQASRAGEVIALDRLLADLAIAKARNGSAGFQLKNDPPRILVSERPAILILIDGEPVLRKVSDTGFNRVINTRVLLLQDKTSEKYYLHLLDGWLQAGRVAGPWSIAILFWHGGSLWIGLAGEPTGIHAHHAIQIALPFPCGRVQFQSAAGSWTSYTAALVAAHHPHAFEARAQLVEQIFVEPESHEGRPLHLRYRNQGIVALPSGTLEPG